MAVHGRQVKTGINIATSGSWGTSAAVATAVGAGDGHYVTDDIAINLTMQQSLDDSASQDYIGSVQTANAEAVEVQIPLYMHYKDAWMNVLYALALGTGGTAPTQQGGSTAYTNTFEPTTNKTGLYATIVQDKSTDIFEVPGAKCTGFELTAGEMGRMEGTFTFMGDLVKEDSTVNTATEISALTFPTQGLRAFLDDAVIRVNAQSSGALTATDAFNVSELTIRFDQPLDTVHVAGQTTIIEPEEDEFPTIEVELGVPRYDADWNAFFASHRANTHYKMDITFTGAAIGTLATTYGVLWQFPNMFLQPVEVGVLDGGGGQLQSNATFQALSTTSAPTGMTGVTVPVRVTTTGEASGNPFA